MRRARIIAAIAAASLATALPALADDGWTVVGRQGILLQVIVPAQASGDLAAYQQQIVKLCAGAETCFINFYTNSTGAAPALPLPDAIAEEATAMLRRSAKQGVDGFRWSCRLQKPEPDCF